MKQAGRRRGADSRKELKHKPLVEAIVEVRWTLESPAQGIERDPHYKFLLGRLFDRVHKDYPEHEQLPTATIPDEFVGHAVQHRFRSAPAEWPLIQVGPGILTVNDTDKYTWEDFRARSVAAVDNLFGAHPKPGALRIEALVLRYIDAVDFDYAKEDVFAFLKANMKVLAGLPRNLFDYPGVKRAPQHFSWQAAFACEKPQGSVSVRFATGQRQQNPSLVWETIVESSGSGMPPMPQEFAAWMDAAHNMTHDWFFKLIAGNLERRFRGD